MQCEFHFQAHRISHKEHYKYFDICLGRIDLEEYEMVEMHTERVRKITRSMVNLRKR